jgi:Domain of unknown function (DUF6265)
MRIFLFLAALLCAPAALAQDIEDLHWMRGCWRSEEPPLAEAGATHTEVWIAPPAPILVGYAYTMGEGELQAWEQMRIEMNGRLEFVAMPWGALPVRFQVVEVDTPNRVAFENMAHDFPKRIEYWREGNRLYARVSDGAGEGQDFAFRRIHCPANLRP